MTLMHLNYLIIGLMAGFFCFGIVWGLLDRNPLDLFKGIAVGRTIVYALAVVGSWRLIEMAVEWASVADALSFIP